MNIEQYNRQVETFQRKHNLTHEEAVAKVNKKFARSVKALFKR